MSQTAPGPVVHSINTGSEPTPSTPANPAPTPSGTPATERPAWLPEKFKSAEDFAKSYGELEARLGKKDDAKPVVPAVPAADPAAPAPVTPTAEAVLTPKDFASYSTELNEAGELSAETYAAIEKKYRLSRDVVDLYLAGQAALGSQRDAEIVSTIGGQDVYTKVTDWAVTNLSAAEQAAYNTAIANPDAEQVKLAVSGLFRRYEQSTSSPGTRLTGGASSDRAGYASQAELISAINDKRYRVDPAYRQLVADRTALSTF